MTVRELDEAPSLVPLYAKSVARGVLPGGGSGDDLPDLELVLRDATVDTDHLRSYARVCGFRLSDRLPPTYPHIQAFPLAIELMSDEDFPFPLVGLVHIDNQLTQHRPVAASEAPTYRVTTRDLRPHPKGRQFDVEATATVGDEVVWESVSTYLQLGGGEGSDGADGEDAPDLPDPSFTAKWRIEADIGRRYASVSGDPNPIHLHPLTARLFGYRRAIAHGMWVKARVLAALEGRLPNTFTARASFNKPLLVPATVRFASEELGGAWRFTVEPEDGGTPHLSGSLSPRS